MRASVDLPQPDGPITQMSSRRCTSERDAVERRSSAAGPAPRRSCDRSRTSRMTGRCLSCVEARRAPRAPDRDSWAPRAVMRAPRPPASARSDSAPAPGSGARPRPRDQRRPAPRTSRARAVRIHGNSCRPSDASTRSVTRPISPIRMIDANTLLVVAVLRLLVDEVGDAGADADQLGDDQVRPGPAEQHAHVGVDVGDDAGNDDARDQHAARRAQRLGGLEQRGIDAAGGVGDDQHLLEEGPDEDDRDLGRVLDAQHRDRERAERGRRQVAEELDERLGQPRPSRGSAPHRMPSGTPMSDDSRKPQKITLMLCHRLSCSHGSSGRAGGVVKPVTSARSHRVRRAAGRPGWQATPIAGRPPRAATSAFSAANAGALDQQPARHPGDVARIGDAHHRVPDERHVADRAPEQRAA